MILSVGDQYKPASLSNATLIRAVKTVYRNRTTHGLMIRLPKHRPELAVYGGK